MGGVRTLNRTPLTFYNIKPPPNQPMQPTPLRVDKIVAILAFKCARTSFRSVTAARLMGNPFGRSR